MNVGDTFQPVTATERPVSFVSCPWLSRKPEAASSPGQDHGIATSLAVGEKGVSQTRPLVGTHSFPRGPHQCFPPRQLVRQDSRIPDGE